jgi:hypothetical protein
VFNGFSVKNRHYSFSPRACSFTSRLQRRQLWVTPYSLRAPLCSRKTGKAGLDTEGSPLQSQNKRLVLPQTVILLQKIIVQLFIRNTYRRTKHKLTSTPTKPTDTYLNSLRYFWVRRLNWHPCWWPSVPLHRVSGQLCPETQSPGQTARRGRSLGCRA